VLIIFLHFRNHRFARQEKVGPVLDAAFFPSMSNLFLREVSLDNFSASIRLYSKKYPLEYLLRIRVKRGINLAVRDDGSSDPYAVIGHAWMPILLYFASGRNLGCILES